MKSKDTSYNKKRSPRRPPYDHHGSDALDRYFRKHYMSKVSKVAANVYMLGIPYLERLNCGLCAPITSNYREIAPVSNISKNSTEKSLNELKGVCCEVVIGTEIKGGGVSTRIRRYTLAELKSGNNEHRLKDSMPAKAMELIGLLNERTFPFEDNPQATSTWKLIKTGRTQSSGKLHIQGYSSERRVEGLHPYLNEGEIIIHADIKCSDPTVIQHIIGYTFPSNPYVMLQESCGMNYKVAKKYLNKLAYNGRPATEAILELESQEAIEFLSPYATAVEKHKARLELKSNGKRRFIQTLGGYEVFAKKGERPHQGKLFSWIVQGTIADIINSSCLKMIELESSNGWKFCFPVHDAVYVIGKPEHADIINSIIKAEARKHGIELEIKIETFLYEANK